MLVISHPDDEVMFFGPTVLGLTKAAALQSINIIFLVSIPKLITPNVHCFLRTGNPKKLPKRK
jgi:hypothetical protein